MLDIYGLWDWIVRWISSSWFVFKCIDQQSILFSFVHLQGTRKEKLCAQFIRNRKFFVSHRKNVVFIYVVVAIKTFSFQFLMRSEQQMKEKKKSLNRFYKQTMASVMKTKDLQTQLLNWSRNEIFFVLLSSLFVILAGVLDIPIAPSC